MDIPGENVGCARAWNRLARSALHGANDVLLITADDVLFEANTIEEMARAMEADDLDFVTAEPGGFSCFLVRQRLFDKTGYFDEQFWPAYFEDDDFHRRMRFAGAREACVAARYVHVNKGSQTVASFNPAERMEHNKRFEANRDRYVAKWGGLPHHERFEEPYNGVREE
jgi:GT2 family glycosyltransferase